MTLVSIIGDFHSSVLPLFYELHKDIGTHIIIYDDARSDTQKAYKIYKGTKKFIKNKRLTIRTELLKIDEDSQHDLEAIKDNILAIQEKDSELIVNATDGLANIALYLAYRLLDREVKFITYDRFDNTCNILDAKQMKSITIQKSMSIDEHFMLKDVEIISQEKYSHIVEYEQELVDFFEGCQGDRTLFAKNFTTKSIIFKKQTGFLYEWYIYILLKNLNYDDIAIGVKIADKYTKTNEIQNELDILIMKENHLHMIECKYLEPFDLKREMIYKLDSVRQTLDEDSRIMLVSNEVYYNEEDQDPHFSVSSLHKRAHNKKIYLRGSPVECPELFIKEIDTIFGLKTKDIEQVIQNRISPQKYCKKEQKITTQDVCHYLHEVFGLDVDYTDKKEIAKLLNYKLNYKNNLRVRIQMQNEKIKTLLYLLNRVKSFDRGTHLEEMHTYFYNELYIGDNDELS